MQSSFNSTDNLYTNECKLQLVRKMRRETRITCIPVPYYNVLIYTVFGDSFKEGKKENTFNWTCRYKCWPSFGYYINYLKYQFPKHFYKWKMIYSTFIQFELPIIDSSVALLRVSARVSVCDSIILIYPIDVWKCSYCPYTCLHFSFLLCSISCLCVLYVLCVLCVMYTGVTHPVTGFCL